ncbi:MAG: hypothetical protein U0610_09830 [bacterium]
MRHQHPERSAELFDPVLAAHVERHRRMRAGAERVRHEVREVAAWSDLQEEPHAVGVHRLDGLAEAHLGMPLAHRELAHGSRLGGKLGGRRARPQLDLRGADADGGVVLGEDRAGRAKALGVIRASPRQALAEPALAAQAIERLAGGVLVARDHELARAIVHRHHQATVRTLQHLVHRDRIGAAHRGEHGGLREPLAGDAGGDVRAVGDGADARVLVGDAIRARGLERHELAARMAHDRVHRHRQAREQGHQRALGRDHGADGALQAEQRFLRPLLVPR